MITACTTVIREHCASILNETQESMLNGRLSSFLDNVHQEFEKNIILRTNFDTITELIVTLIAIDKRQWSKQPQLLQHQMFVFLRDCLVEFLLDEKQRELVTKLSIVLHDICDATVINDEMVNLILYKPLVDQMNAFITDIEQNSAATKQIEPINRVLRIFRSYQMMRIDLHQDSLLELLFLKVSKCISSQFMMAQLSSTPRAMINLDPLQTFLFDTCIEFMYWQPYEESSLRRKGLTPICEAHLPAIVHTMSSLSFAEPVMRVAC
jgi:hypothetical protein